MTAPRAAVRGGVAIPVALWLVTRTLLVLTVFKVLLVPGQDVTPDVTSIYRGWSQVLSGGTFPLHDITWQYPPSAALAVLSPHLLPFLDYATAFYLLCLLADAVVTALLLYAGRRPGRRPAGAWVWVVGIPLLGPTAYARYDVMVTGVAVAGVLAAVRRPGVGGLLAGFGATMKVWPVLLVAGVARGRRCRSAWGMTLVAMVGVAVAFSLTMPGALEFLTFQGERGTEVESLGSLVFHLARHAGWGGRVALNYGSMEFLGPWVPLVSDLALTLTVMAFGWLLVWRWRAREFTPATVGDAAFTAVLLFTTTSRVISPQYMVWLVGLAAAALTVRGTRQSPSAVLVLLATAATFWEFPVHFVDVVTSSWLGITLLAVRNGLLVAACVVSCRRLWSATVEAPPAGAAPRRRGTVPGPSSEAPGPEVAAR
ncbi:glycosyltransferase 87 family protein [Streptomyces sp. NPDC059740]|uniref:glycosyltransferase 87 family protein n=1 Tax=Streptomyces sp. NPDC059740 TaxID=3346926 RepID=UPI00365969B5